MACHRSVGNRAGLRRGTAAGRFLVDRMLLVHLLEHAENRAKRSTRCGGCCRRLAGSSSWCPTAVACGRASSTRPSARGGRFRAGQLDELLLRDANFTPARWADGLDFPPSKRHWLLKFHNIFERSGRRFWPIFSGVIVVEAQKRLYQGRRLAQRASRRVFMPVLSPAGRCPRPPQGCRLMRPARPPITEA